MLAEKLHYAHLNNPKPQILVIGDLMLDHYIFGTATRLSPEAPVPVVNVQKETKIVGGAANVASNLVDLGAKVALAGIIGTDTFGAEIIEILQEKQIETELVLKDASRTTTVKTRVIAGNHQIVRIDMEDVHDITVELEDRFLTSLNGAIQKSDIIILSDYNKGLLTHALSLRIIASCNAHGKKIIVDPKGLDYSKYAGAYLIKPNRKELAEAAKTDKVRNQEELERAATVIFECTSAAYLIVTLSEGGIAFITPDTSKILPVVATEVYDVTGAGDTVIATLAYCLSLGFPIEDACHYSNYAASIVIKQIGSATTTIEEIISAIKNNP
jgi:rfaE bifunctional protein kinase chain/domain